MAEIILDDNGDEVMDSSALAEAMGFSGFGTQRAPSSKKRKFNPHADAAVDDTTSDGTNVNVNVAASTTGANNAPLGQRRKMRLPPPSAAGETDLGDFGREEEEKEEEDDGNVPGDEDAARYMDTSRPARGYLPEELAAIEAQGKIDAILGSGGIPGLPARPPPPAAAAAGGEAASLSVGHRFGPPPPPPRQHGQRNNNKHHHRRPDEEGATGNKTPWWQGYYDPQTNQNPWEALEKKMGLAPRGTWLPRNHNNEKKPSAGGGKTETRGGGRETEHEDEADAADDAHADAMAAAAEEEIIVPKDHDHHPDERL